MPSIPNPENANVEESKIRDYLLNVAHRKGRSKAKFFKARGFREDALGVLKSALRRHCASHPVARKSESRYGVRYEVECEIDTPDGSNPCIKTVWQIEVDDSAPRLITAYPLKANN